MRSRSLTVVRSARRVTAFAWILLSVDFLDELASGVPAAGASEIQLAFGVSNTAIGALITAFGLLALVLEPPLFFLSDRYPRRWFVCGGLFGLGLSCLAAALSPSYGWLFAALLLFGPLSGCGVSLSQATLVDSDPDRAERWLTRWTLAGALGDLATPGLLALTAALGVGWRGAFAVCGVYSIAQAVLLWRQRFPDDTAHGHDVEVSSADVSSLGSETSPSALPDPGAAAELDSDYELPWRRALSFALRNRGLLIWALALTSCALLDEILVAFAVLHMTRDLALPQNEALLVLACLSAGGVVGLIVIELLHGRFPPLRLLQMVCVGGLITYAGFLISQRTATLVLWALLAGVFIGLQYPLAKAQLYRALPGRSGTAVAIAGLFGPVELALPLLIGWIADTEGLKVALWVLALQPVALLLASLTWVARNPEADLA